MGRANAYTFIKRQLLLDRLLIPPGAVPPGAIIGLADPASD